jgi:SAM-dependent methyltransferase
MDDVVLLTMSEFGRTARENGTRGTDHGHGNAMLVLGNSVKGGAVYGDWKGLKNDQLNEGRDLAVTTDFRDVFGEVALKHLGSKDLNKIFPRRSVVSIIEESKNYPEITAIRADAFHLPFADDSFDYVICSLFTHHFTDEKLVPILAEFSRVACRKIFVIDLHRHRAAYVSYKMFCAAFRISRLVREDGSLSILRGFKPDELEVLAGKANLKNVSVKRFFPFRLVLECGENESL